MSKNMTRKGLAISAAGALALTGLTAAPASAASASLAVSAGTTYVGLVGETFTLQGGWSNDIANFANVKVAISNPDGIGFTVTYTDTSGADAQAVVAGDATKVLTATANGSAPTVAISATDGAADVTVQMWSDDDGDNTVDAGETASPARTVSFLKVADVTFSVILSDVTAGDEELSAQVLASGNVNLSQVENDHLQVVFRQGSDSATAAANAITKLGVAAGGLLAGDGIDTAWDNDTGKLTATAKVDDDNDGTVDAVPNDGIVIYAQAMYDASNDGTPGTDEVGTFDFQEVAATKVTDINELVVTESANAIDGGGSGSLRAATAASHEFTYFVHGAAEAAQAGVTVAITIAETGNDTLAAAASVTAGGKTLTNADDGKTESITFNVVTDADGNAVFTVSVDGDTADGDTIAISAAAEGVTEAADTYTFVRGDVASIYAVGRNAATDVTGVTAADATVSVTYHIIDIFGVPATNDYRVEVTGGAATVRQATSNGVATVSAKLDGVGATTLAAAVQVKFTDGNYYAFDDAALDGTEYEEADAAKSVNTLFDVISALSVNALGLNDPADEAVLGKALVSGDGRVQTFGDGLFAYKAADGTNITGTVTAINNTATNTPVTISAAGLGFVTSNGIYAKDSITVLTSAAGAFSVAYVGNVAGDYTITVTSGTKSEEIEVAIEAAVQGTESAVNMSVTGNEPGKTMVVSGTVVDAFGNPVPVVADDFSLTYDGPGLLVGTLPTSVGADGSFKFKVLLGQNETVAGTVSVETAGADKENLAGDTAAQQADNITATLSIAPAAPVAADTKVNAGSFKGYVAVYAKGYEGKRLSAKVGKDWVVVPALASNFVRVVEYTGAGYTINVRIYIDRVLVDTITVTTK